MSECIFCKIAAGEIPSERVYEDNWVYAFRDINPQAPTHVLVIPKEHIDSAACLHAGNSVHAAKCFEAISAIAENERLSGGFRVVSNVGEDAGQTVKHLHFHVLAGKKLPEQM